MKFDQEISTLVEERYPYPIGSKFKKLRTNLISSPSVQLKQLIELFEVTLRYLTTLACRGYLYEDGNNKKVNSLLHNFNRPSNGHWLELLRECLLHHRKLTASSDSKSESEKGPRELIDNLVDFYFRPLPEKRNNDLYKSTADFVDSQNLNIDLKPANNSLIDLFVVVRNLTSHGASSTEREYEQIIGGLWPVLNHLLSELGFLAKFGLYFVKEVRAEKGVFIHDVIVCMGKDFNVARLKLADEPLNNQELYLFSFDLSENDPTSEISSPSSILSALDVSWALSLSPYMVLEQCDECKQDQIFIFNKFLRKNLEYLSYNCGHDFHPSAHLKDFENIFGFLEGKISVRELFKGKTVGKTFEEDRMVICEEDRAESIQVYSSAKNNIHKGEIVLAIKELNDCIRLNQDHAEAYFNLAMCQILQEENLESILRNLDRCIAIDPENPHYKFCQARIFYEIGLVDDSIAKLKSTLDSDPSHQDAKELLEQLTDSQALELDVATDR